MYGTWFIGSVGAVMTVIALVGAFALSAWSPIFAVIVFVLAALALAGVAALRRSQEYHDQAESSPGPADPLTSRATGAPAGGPGDSSALPPSPGAPSRTD